MKMATHEDLPDMAAFEARMDTFAKIVVWASIIPAVVGWGMLTWWAVKGVMALSACAGLR